MIVLAVALASCDARAAVQAAPSLVDFSLEQLADIVVTSVSRRETRLADVPASIAVISGADIRRSGAVSLPEALRLAPNLQVARADTSNYAVTARGFGSTIENKLLVLIDGRSVYSPLFSGVFWDMQDVVMEDIERIEVISGPGATIWGANAVNGVINIITRSAAETQGGLLVGAAGTPARGGALRHGGALGNGGHYRVYGQYAGAADTSNAAGVSARNGLQRRQAGFRADWNGRTHGVTVSGDVYQGKLETPDPAAFGATGTRISGANLLGRINRGLADGSELRLHAYLEHTERDAGVNGAQILDTVDVEAQHGVRIGEAHSLVWGGGSRYSRDRIENGQAVQFAAPERGLHWSNLFAQDEISLRPALRLTLGMKFEHNSYSGLEALPAAHLAWSFDNGGLLWTGASRTVRAPSRIERDLWLVDARNPGPGAAGNPGAPRYLIVGSPQFASETARVLEAGYRGHHGAALTYAATLFYSAYDKLRTLEPMAGQGGQFGNFGKGFARGLELWGRWQVKPAWRLSGGMVLQDIRTGLRAGSLDTSAANGVATDDPSSYWSLRSSHDLADDLQADLMLRHVGSLPNAAVPDYTELDARIAWQPGSNLELSLTGHNLLHRSHAEFGAAATRQVFERAVLAKLVLRF